MPGIYIPPAGQTTILDPGSVVQVVTGATGTGTGFSAQFTVQARADDGDHDVTFQAIKNAIVTLTADLQASSDGGVTFDVLVAAIDFVTNSGVQQPTIKLMPGLVYRFNIKTFSGTSVNINAIAS